MTKKKTILSVFGTLIIAGGVFYGGMAFGKTKSTAKAAPNFQNLTAQQRQQFAQNGGAARGGFGNRAGGAGTSGEIIGKDDKTITVKMPDGSSKIIFYSGSTTVAKQAAGAITDLNIGTSVLINGTSNSDGSLTAQTIQIRPAAPITTK
jgi:hypothetical protein